MNRFKSLGIALLGLICLPTSLVSSVQAEPRIATVDWTIAETLLALGITPAGMGDMGSYGAWVTEPVMPSSVVDLGLRAQPNRELLAELEPDLILISPLAAPLAPTLSQIAPVKSITLYSPEGDYWAQLAGATRDIAALVDKSAEADSLLTGLDEELAELKAGLPKHLPPLLLVQFIDERHVRVFGQHSMYDSVMGKLGLRNAWQAPTNYWGFASVSIESLATMDEARLVIVDPLPSGVAAKLAAPGLWQHLPLVQRAKPLHLPPVWSFGGVLSARRFAQQLSLALTTDAGVPHE
ncbi:iron complex transport system substrate-binding protein [Aeromonas sp. BIGb0405]|nr:iron complex transport system substrate-binding protein [Aeromonas sp. BIGb0405]